jgi:hypothetical protein
MNEPIKECPICSGLLNVSRLTCRQCDTEISGQFRYPAAPLHLDDDLIDFIKVFIYAEGSIKQSEKILNCSYPKIKNLLKKTKSALGLPVEIEGNPGGIIDKLDKGKIDVAEALELLKKK